MTNKKPEVVVEKRRKLLIGAGSGTLAAWSVPIISSITMPAHAQMSQIASFSVEKVQSGGPSPATVVGDVIEYTITVTNTGDVPLTGVVATDTLPDGTVVVLSDPLESLTADGILEVGEQWVYATTYTASLADLLAGAPLINTVSVGVDEVPGPQTDSADTPVIQLTPADLCPVIVIGNTVSGPVSGTNVPPVCTLAFDILSGTAGTPLTITSVTTSALPANTTVTVDGLGEATDSVGPRVVWSGPAVNAPFCLPIEVIDDITFTVTASCDASSGDTFTQDFLLSSLV